MKEIKEYPRHTTNLFRLTDSEIAVIHAMAFYMVNREMNFTPKAKKIVEKLEEGFRLDNRILSLGVFK